MKCVGRDIHDRERERERYMVLCWTEKRAYRRQTEFPRTVDFGTGKLASKSLIGLYARFLPMRENFWFKQRTVARAISTLLAKVNDRVAENALSTGINTVI